MQHKRLTINQLRNWRSAAHDARAWGDPGILTTADLMRHWGHAVYRSPRPAPIARRRRERADREWASFTSALAKSPPPQPPAGKVFGFANGTEYDCWTAYNCDRCALAGDPSVAGSSRCAIFEAIHDAHDGCFPVEIAERMQWAEHRLELRWRCPEFVEESRLRG